MSRLSPFRSSSSAARMAVPDDLNVGLAVFERRFDNLVGEIAVHVEFVERFGEEFSLEREVHADRAVET